MLTAFSSSVSAAAFPASTAAEIERSADEGVCSAAAEITAQVSHLMPVSVLEATGIGRLPLFLGRRRSWKREIAVVDRVRNHPAAAFFPHEHHVLAVVVDDAAA